jgi:hypothetical protein
MVGCRGGKSRGAFILKNENEINCVWATGQEPTFVLRKYDQLTVETKIKVKPK